MKEECVELVGKVHFLPEWDLRNISSVSVSISEVPKQQNASEN